MSKRGNEDAYDPESTKRSRKGEGSRVIFCRGVPADCQESELLALCCPFAVVEKTLMIENKGQAFVQLADVASATNLVEFYKTRNTKIRESTVQFEFSTRDEITTRDGGQSNQGQQGASRSRGSVGVPNTILMISVTKLQYEMNVDVLHQVFAGHGQVLKIVTFFKNDEFKALVQMKEIQEAQNAQQALDGRDIYTGCNTLHIVFSKHTELRVRCNNDRSKDFTNPNLPTTEEPKPRSGMLGNGPRRDTREANYRSNSPDFRGRGPPEDRFRPRNYGMPPNNRYGAPPDSFDARRGDIPPHVYDGPPSRASFDGPPPRNGGYDGPPRPGYDNNLRPGYDGPPSRMGYDNIPRPGYDGRPMGPPGFNRFEGPPPRGFDPRYDRPRSFDPAAPARSGFDDHRYGDRDRRPLDPRGRDRSNTASPRLSPVLICSNIEKHLAIPSALFALFGCFGDILRIKVLFKKQDTALVQFVDTRHASTARELLDGVTIFGSTLRVDHSRHASVSMPRGDANTFEVDHTKDYSNSPLHRYRDGRNMRNIVAPCPGLHVSGIGPDIQGDSGFFTELFSEYGKVEKATFFEKDSRMAMIDMANLDDAVNALVSLDNYETHGHHLRVSFSKAYQRNHRNHSK